MFGKSFASQYTGSMFGSPALVFAVWGYVISNMKPSRRDGACYVELNPLLLSPMFSTTIDEVMSAIEYLESPDLASRSKDEDGKRLVQLDEHCVGPMQFRVVNGTHYREMRDEESRRIYLREAKRKERAKSTDVLTVNRRQPPSTQAEAEAEAEAEESKAGAAKAAAHTTGRRTTTNKAEVPEDYTPSPEDREWARNKQHMGDADIDRETERFVTHHRAKGNRFVRPSLAWRNWMTGRFIGGTNGHDRTDRTDRRPMPRDSDGSKRRVPVSYAHYNGTD